MNDYETPNIVIRIMDEFLFSIEFGLHSCITG